MDKPRLSIIMPALNEERNIAQAIEAVVKAFDVFRIKGEIIVVNDGSRDSTPRIAERLTARLNTVLRLINHDKPQGIGASFWDGVDNAQAEAVCMLPADNENNPSEILRYLKLLDDVDVIIPFVFNKEVRPLLRNILSFIYISIINVSFAVSFNYTNGTVIYRKSLLENLPCRCRGFFFQTDILIRLAKKGYLFAEVPYKLGVRKKDGSKALSFSSLRRVAGDYTRLLKDIYLKKEGGKRRDDFSKTCVSEGRYQG